MAGRVQRNAVSEDNDLFIYKFLRLSVSPRATCFLSRPVTNMHVPRSCNHIIPYFSIRLLTRLDREYDVQA